mmetsp:Transcript_9132/g.19587  ORF Transcript_9132/g.19587 Transcript_9132/m.19587 type:complete len:81 (+) Transcript_9132:62-304(+)
MLYTSKGACPKYPRSTVAFNINKTKKRRSLIFSFAKQKPMMNINKNTRKQLFVAYVSIPYIQVREQQFFWNNFLVATTSS